MSSTMTNIALLIIDCQQSFVRGLWMSGIGKADVEPILSAYDNVSALLPTLSSSVRLLVTQCPFPTPSDFDFYPPFRDALVGREGVTKVIKPGNSVLRAAGAIQWFDSIVADGIKSVVITGCTLTSCVRVSAIDVHQRYAKWSGLQTTVDLSLCGARADNYRKRCPSCLHDYLRGSHWHSTTNSCQCDADDAGFMMSPVDKAINDLTSLGVNVVESFDWSSFKVSHQS